MVITSIRDAMNNAPFGLVHRRVFVFAALGILMDGYDFFIVAAALPLIQAAWHPAPAVLGLIGAAATVGAIVGGAWLGRFADRLGRRTVAMLTMTMFAIVSVISAFAWNVASLILFRAVLGMAIGADYPTGSSYVAEFMPARLRPQLLFASLSFQALGAVLGALLGLGLLGAHSTGAWRFMLAVGAIPALIILYLRRGLPESPRWLFNHGREAEAQKVLSDILGEPVTLQVTGEQPTPAMPFLTLFDHRFIHRTILACVPWFCMDVALYGMALFVPLILANVGFGGGGDFWTRDAHALQGAAVLDVLLIVGFAIGIYLVGRLRQTWMQIAGFIGMTLALLLVAFASHNQAPLLIFAAFGLFNILVNAGPNGTTYMIAAELFPTPLRASGSGLAASMGKLGASFGIFLVPVMRSEIGLTETLVVVAAISAVGLAVTVALRHEMDSAGVVVPMRHKAALTAPVPA